MSKVTEKKAGVSGYLRFFFQKTAFFLIAIHTKAGMLFGQHFDGGPPRNLKHVFLRQFENGFNKKLACICSKSKMMEPPSGRAAFEKLAFEVYGCD